MNTPPHVLLLPQTEEAIGCAEELGVPVVVALNKADVLLKAYRWGGGQGALTAAEAEAEEEGWRRVREVEVCV